MVPFWMAFPAPQRRQTRSKSMLQEFNGQVDAVPVIVVAENELD